MQRTNRGYYGLYGGTFDPIHNGHLKVAQAILQQCHLSDIDFLPVAMPAHRALPESNFTMRMQMIELAIGDYPQLHANNCEVILPKPSFTYSTIVHLQTRYPQNRYCLIVGMDAFEGFCHWYRWQDILKLLPIIVITRPGHVKPEKRPTWWENNRLKLLPDESGKKTGILELEIAALDISSSEIKNRINNNLDVLDCLPASVYDYIKQHSLYS